jgi:hypothetical protein
MAMTKRGVVPTSAVNTQIILPSLTIENMWKDSEFFLREDEVYILWKYSKSSFNSFHLLSEFLSHKKLIMGVWFTREVELVQLPANPEIVMSYLIEEAKH